MTAGQLIELLKTYPPYYEVVAAKSIKDEVYSPVEKVESGRFLPWTESPFNSHLGEILPVAKKNQNCVCLIPEA